MSQHKPRILVIRGGAIGDFILTLPAIRLLRENFRDAHLEILGYRHIAALAERRYYAEAIRSIEYAALSGFFVPNSELAADLQDYFGSFHQVISYLYDPDGFFEANVRRCGVKHFLAASPKLDDSAHAAQQLARPLERLALYLEESGAMIHPSVEDTEFAKAFVREADRPLLALHPGSGSERKNWPVERWASLGERLWSCFPGAKILLIGGEADMEVCEVLTRKWPVEAVIKACGLPLPKLAAVIARCDLFLGHDSGISHLAAAVGSRCVLLFGPTDPEVWAPRNAGVRIVNAPGGELEQLELEAVEAAVIQHLAASGR